MSAECEDAVLCLATRGSQVTKSLEVLLGIKSRDIFKGQLVLPGGKFDVGDNRSPQACASREFGQETGLFVPPNCWNVLGSLFISESEGSGLILNERIVDLMHTDLSEHPTNPSDSAEIHDLAWHGSDSLASKNMPVDYFFWLPQVLDSLEPGLAIVSYIQHSKTISTGNSFLAVPGKRLQQFSFNQQ